MGLDHTWQDWEIALLIKGEPVPTRSPQGQRGKFYRMGLRKPRPKAPPKPVPDRIRPPPTTPRPEWWARAQKLRASGFGTVEIGQIMGRTRGAVLYALDPKRRETERNRMRRYWHSLDPVDRQESRGRYPRDSKREHAREIARDRWRDQGGSLTDHYRKLECL